MTPNDRAPKVGKKKANEFVQGYACALSGIVRSHGTGTEIKEALIACGLTSVPKMRKLGVDEFDITVLAETVRDIQATEARKKVRRER